MYVRAVPNLACGDAASLLMPIRLIACRPFIRKHDNRERYVNTNIRIHTLYMYQASVYHDVYVRTSCIRYVTFL